MGRYAWSIVAGVALAGCTEQLHPEAAHVRVTRGQPPKGYERVADLACQQGGGMFPLDNVDECRVRFRNAAAAQGADLVVIESQQLGLPQCPSCVVMEGGAFRKQR